MLKLTFTIIAISGAFTQAQMRPSKLNRLHEISHEIRLEQQRIKSDVRLELSENINARTEVLAANIEFFLKRLGVEQLSKNQLAQAIQVRVTGSEVSVAYLREILHDLASKNIFRRGNAILRLELLSKAGYITNKLVTNANEAQVLQTATDQITKLIATSNMDSRAHDRLYIGLQEGVSIEQLFNCVN
jgi:hypothetical protein